MSDSFNRNINQQGVGDGTTSVNTSSNPHLDAIVEDIVINEHGGRILKYDPDGSNIGQILFREIPEDRFLQLSQLRTAFPAETSFLEYPLPGEQVIINRTMGTFYYSRRIHTTRNVSDSVWVGLQNTSTSVGDTDTSPTSRTLLRAGVAIPKPTGYEGAATKITSKTAVRYLRPSPGDLTVRGRFGNSIRLGSNLFNQPTETNPKPNIILTAGQWEAPEEVSTTPATPFSMYYENINMDKSSIWVVANQTVPFLAATATSRSPKKAHVFSSKIKTTVYDGAQIFLNSDRIVINSKVNEISLFSHSEINLSSVDAITLDTETDIHLNASKDVTITTGGVISLEGSQILMSSQKDLSFKTSGIYSILGKKIFIGKYGDTGQPMVLGGNLALWLNAFVSTLLAPGAILTPTGPAVIRPDALVKLRALQAQLGTKMTPQLAMFNSKDNFTAERNTI